MPIRLMLADDSEVVRVGLAAVIGQDPELELAGQAATSESAVAFALTLSPDLVLLDVRLPLEGGIEAGRKILEAQPTTRVLFLSAFSDEELVRAAVLIGAHGYLLKEIDAQSLITSIKRVASGESLLDAGVRQGVLEWVIRNVSATETSTRNALTPQEHRIVALVADGKTNKEIAVALDLSPKTIKNYLHKVFDKLGIQRRSQAAAMHAKRQVRPDVQ
jgi:two-component system, NarL family, response regulator DevR